MSESRLPDYLDQMLEATLQACGDLMESFTPELKRLLLAAGYGFVRVGKGDYQILRRIGSDRTVDGVRRKNNGVTSRMALRCPLHRLTKKEQN